MLMEVFSNNLQASSSQPTEYSQHIEELEAEIHAPFQKVVGTFESGGLRDRNETIPDLSKLICSREQFSEGELLAQLNVHFCILLSEPKHVQWKTLQMYRPGQEAQLVSS